jgi:hypothetical protein
MLATEVARLFREVTHHPDGESFRRALQLGCRICLQLWAKLDKPDELFETSWTADYSFRKPITACSIHFYHRTPGAHISRDLILVPSNDACTLVSSNVSLSNSTGSDQTFEFLLSKYKQCKQNHTKCLRTGSQPYLPSRLLDVGYSETSTIALVDQEHVPMSTAYVALSHCWGSLQPIKLTSSTDSTLRNGIADLQLPTTFKQAVAVTRKLGLRYIWIDSL